MLIAYIIKETKRSCADQNPIGTLPRNQR